VCRLRKIVRRVFMELRLGGNLGNLVVANRKKWSKEPSYWGMLFCLER
jgi:hypothetical protein